MAPGGSTTSANMSLRRGARLSAAVMIPLWIAAALAMLSRGFRTYALADMGRRSPSAWLAIVLLLGLSAWIIYEALKSGRIRLTPDQIGQGRDDAFNLMFASSTHDVLEAIQDHLPPGVRLRVY